MDVCSTMTVVGYVLLTKGIKTTSIKQFKREYKTVKQIRRCAVIVNETTIHQIPNVVDVWT